jgi:hypothetical protein
MTDLMASRWQGDGESVDPAEKEKATSGSIRSPTRG